MKKFYFCLISFALTLNVTLSNAQERFIPHFKLAANDLKLERLANPGKPFIKAGRKFAILGNESGSFEAWAYPLKILRNFEFSFFVRNSTRPIHGKDIVHRISTTPETTTLTYIHQAFTIKAIYLTSISKPGAIILLKVDSTEPLTIVCSFLPVLQPMWPAGIGGQYAYWDENLNGYIISEPTRKNHGIIGSPAASGISYTPAHMLSDTPNEFKIDIPASDQIKNKYIPIYIAGGKGPRENVIKTYKDLKNNPQGFYKENLKHYRNLRKNTMRIQTPNRKLNLAYEWAKVVFDSLVVDNPDLGKGLIAGLEPSGTSGRPGFGWFFGGDAYINSFSLLSYGAHKITKEILLFTQKWQRKDGKMAHELSQASSYIDWWHDYPYGYIHGDTTPYYIASMYDYVKKTGDIGFIKKSWDSLKRAYEWCLSTDVNNDGLMDNKKAGLGALEYGALTGIETDIYLAAIWTRAAYAMKQLAEIAGQKSYSQKADQHYQMAKKAFDQKFWDEESQFYAYAFNANGEHVKEISPWNSVGLMWDYGESERSLRSLERLCSSELSTDWGIRSLSVKSQYYEPLNYNYGAVWPFITSWVTASLYKHHMPLHAHALLLSTAMHTFDNALGSITEVYSGAQNIWPQEAVAHQGFSSAGVILPLVRGMIGLEGNALNKTITYAPQFPANWEHISIDNYKIENADFSFKHVRRKNKIHIHIQTQRAEEYTMLFSPSLQIGSKIKSLKLNDKSIPFKIIEEAQSIQPQANIPINEKNIQIEILFIPTIEILPYIPNTKTGDGNKGLKIIRIQRKGPELNIQVEGLAGKWYELDVLNMELAEEIKGAEYKNGKLRFQISGEQRGEFVLHQITIRAKN